MSFFVQVILSFQSFDWPYLVGKFRGEAKQSKPRQPPQTTAVEFLHSGRVPSTQTSEEPKGPMVQDKIQSPESPLSPRRTVLEPGVDFFFSHFFATDLFQTPWICQPEHPVGERRTSVRQAPSLVRLFQISPPYHLLFTVTVLLHGSSKPRRFSFENQWKLLWNALKIIVKKTRNKLSVRALCFYAAE